MTTDDIGFGLITLMTFGIFALGILIGRRWGYTDGREDAFLEINEFHERRRSTQ